MRFGTKVLHSLVIKSKTFITHSFELMELKDVEKLAELARIEMNDDEKKELLGDLQSILGYVDQIESVEVQDIEPDYTITNVMREDEEPHAKGMYTEELLNSAPQKKDGYIKVKQIL